MILLLLHLFYLFRYSVDRNIELQRGGVLVKILLSLSHLVLLVVPLLHNPVGLQVVRGVLQQVCALHFSLLEVAAVTSHSLLEVGVLLRHSLAVQPVLLITSNMNTISIFLKIHQVKRSQERSLVVSSLLAAPEAEDVLQTEGSGAFLERDRTGEDQEEAGDQQRYPTDKHWSESVLETERGRFISVGREERRF